AKRDDFSRNARESPTMASQETLTEAVSEFARTLASGSSIGDVMTDLAERLTAVLRIAGAGVSVLDSGRIRFVAASDEECAALERTQEAAQSGPAVEACRTGRIVLVADLADASSEWGRYGQAARQAGVVAVAAIPMRQDDDCIGTVDLHSASAREWS